jgi:nitroreductase
MNVLDALKKRRSITYFDPEYVLDDDALSDLLDAVRHTPSSFNLQHWQFIVVRNSARKAELCEAAYDQRQVRDCSAAIFITARVDAHEEAALCWEQADNSVRDNMVKMINDFYGGAPQFQRDEAIRSGGMVAMSLLLRATEMGLQTGPIIGFDPEKVSGILGIPDNHICVMLICVGKQAKPPFPSPGRFSLAETVRLEKFDGDVFSPHREE